MNKVRRIAGLAVAGLLIAPFLAGPASADNPETFAGNAAGTALELNALGQDLTFGSSAAKVTSGLTAVADGAGQAAIPGTVTHSEVSGDNTAASQPQTCSNAALQNDQLNALLAIGLACSQTNVAVSGKNPIATGTASVASVGLSANTVLSQTPIGSTLQQVLAPITSAEPTHTLGSLIDSVFNSKTLEVTVGAATSAVSTAAGTVTSQATTAAAVIKILPTPSINGQPSTDPIITITVGQAAAKAVYDRASGQATPTVDPALVRININPLIAQGLGLPPETTVTVDQDVPVPGTAGTPLDSEVKVGHGTTTKNADGSITATADGVSIALLRGINGGITLNLAHAVASVGGTPAVVTAPVSVPQLPRTGESPLLPIAGAVLLGCAVLVRRATRRVHRVR